ncbi:MAG: SigB/SigF/SigG family RNA polymerase sigma factor [Clostridia bacterium]|nr:SigB/SigF/SigG family RNA polymerase sigma factor [Clostridia bacterium]
MNELILRAQNGDTAAMNKIIEENVGLVWNVVKRFSNRGYDIEDLFQIGSMGFVKAIKRFDVSMGNQLSTYAVSMIIGEIRRFLRDDGMVKVSRSLKEIAAKAREIMQREPEKDYTVEKIAEMLEVDKEEIIEALDATNAVDSLDRQVSDDADSKTIGDNIASKKNDYEKLMNQMTIDSLLNVLDEREKKVIIYRYYKEMTQSKVAEVYGTSQVQVSRIEKKALEKMKMAIW